MRLPHVVAPALALILGIAACEDSKAPPAVPTAPPSAPAAPSAMTPDDMPNAALDLEHKIASVCKAYRKERARVKKELLKTPNDEDLKAQAKALKEMTDDACN